MKLLLRIMIFLAGVGLYAQTDGLTYQAVILDPNVQELPGVNATGNILPNTAVTLRFTILANNGSVEYKELHETRTDIHGIINLVIGQGQPLSANNFTDIFWDGTPKSLKVEISFGGSFNELNDQNLTFVPYAYHRDIIATRDLNVAGNVLFRDDLVVDGTTNLNSSLDVNNESATQLSGTLVVEGTTNLNNNLDVSNQSPTRLSGVLEVDGASNLRNRLIVSDFTTLNSTLSVDGRTQLKSTLDVEGATHLHDRLVVDGTTQLNNTLSVGDATILRAALDVTDATTLNDALRVSNQRATMLTGTLTVDGETDFNGNVIVNNSSDVTVSGNMSIGGATILQQDVTVEGATNLNNSLSVNNGNPTSLSGLLHVDGQTSLGDALLAQGPTDLNNLLRVNNLSPTIFSGELVVDLATNLNGRLMVNNWSPTYLSGSLNVDEEIDFGNHLTVDGIANFNEELNVLNGALVQLSGDLDVDGNTNLGGYLNVINPTTFNNNTTVTNLEATSFTGLLEVDGATTLNNQLDVTGQFPSQWNGTLMVDEAMLLNNSLEVTNEGIAQFTGSLSVGDMTSIHSNLTVTNGSSSYFSGSLIVGSSGYMNALNVNNEGKTDLSGNLDVTGVVTLGNTLNVANATTINNDFTVTGSANLTSLNTGGISVINDNPNFLATLSNLDQGNGGGISIKLGRDHGRWTGSSILKIDQTLISNDPVNNTPPSDPLYITALNTVKSKFQNPGPFSMSEIVGLSPLAVRLASIGNINNLIFQEVQAQLNFPKDVPSVTMPSFAVPGFENEIVFFNGLSPICSGQHCFSVCFPFAGCVRVCVPPVNVCVPTIPKIAFPALRVPQVNVAPTFNNFIPPLPTLSEAGLPDVSIPSIPTAPFSNSLSNENEYMTFQDKDQRKTGAIRAVSVSDFANSTILDDVYVINVASKFINIDLLKSIVQGGATMVDLINQFNKMGVEYTSGNGDYAEWLERSSVDEYLTPGDIVGVRGGKISKNLNNFEQLMVVSHRPIVMGNDPSKEREHLGNRIAFIGQVPVKVMGPTKTGDYIVANKELSGYGRAISPKNMKAEDFKWVVGRAWEENKNQGPKLVNTVVGIRNGDFANTIKQLVSDQKTLDVKLTTLEDKIARISEKLDKTINQEDYADKE